MQQLPKIQKKDKVHTTQIPVGGIVIGADFLVIAGPCAVESREQIMQAAASVKAAGSNMLWAAPISPDPRHTVFRVWARRASNISKKPGRPPGCR